MERQTDVQICYAINCANNNALVCDLIRIDINDVGHCLQYEAMETEDTTN